MRLVTKLLLFFIPVALAAAFGTSLLAKRAVHDSLVLDLVERRTAQIEELAGEIRPGLAARDETLLLPLLESLRRDLSAGHAGVHGRDGETVAHTNVAEVGKVSDDPFVRGALLAQAPVWREVDGPAPVLELFVPVWDRRGEARKEFLLTAAGPARRRRLGTLRLELDLAQTMATGEAVSWRVLSLVGCFDLLTLIALFFLVRGLLAPVARLTEGVERVGRGEYGTPVEVTKGDEVGALAARFNQMSADLARTTVSRDYLNDILENTLDAIFVADPKGRILTVNRALLEMLGYDRSELLGLHASVLIFGASSAATEPGLQWLLAPGSRNVEFYLMTKSGGRIPVLFARSVMKGPDGRVCGIIGAAKDITQRMKAEAELSLRNAMLQAQQEASPAGILVVDAHGAIRSHNRRFIEMWGLPVEVVSSRSDTRALQAVLGKLADPEAFLARVRYLYDHPAEDSRDEIALIDGRTFERFSSPIKEADGVSYFGRVWFFDDVTQRKKAEQAKAVRERDLLQREFVDTVSHELRTPIMAIQGFAEALREGGLEDAENRLDFVVTIERHAIRLGALVDDILALSVLDAGKRRLEREVIPLSNVIEAALLAIAPLVKDAGLTLRVESSPGLRVSADPAQLSRVLLNLLENAVKYNHPEGWIEVWAATDGPQARVSVCNSGMAISPQDLPRIFERFHRADSRRVRKIHGTGLGLAIAKEIVELHGGRIWAESPEGGGCALHFTVPLG